jgi:hypothetical protein
MKAGTTVGSIAKLTTLVGTFSIHELREPVSGEIKSVFRLSDATAVHQEDDRVSVSHSAE